MRAARSKVAVSLLALAVAAFAPGIAQAQSTAVQEPTGTDPVAASLEPRAGREIVVTAQRREERLVDVPISVTTLGTEQLTTANVRELADITKLTPGLRFDASGSFVQPTIRGVGTAVVTSGGGANVGIYIDGFYSANPLAANTQLLNVESIQVLKGPQGTLFGRNTTGGAILIQTAEPREEPAAQVKASYGRFNQLQTQAYATAGLAPGVAFDIEGLYRRGDGFLTNIANGDDEIGKFENWSVRAGLKMTFSDDVSLLIRYQHGDTDDPTTLAINTYVDPVLGVGAPGFAPAGSFTTDPDRVALDRRPFFRSKSDLVQATLRWDLGFADLTSYTQRRTEDSDLSEELDFVAIPVFTIGIPVFNETWSQELLLTSKPGTPLQWTAGLFYFSNRDRYKTFVDNAGAFRAPFGPNRLGGSSATTKSYAAFVDATYEVTPELFVTAGARYAHDVVTDALFERGPVATGVAGAVQTVAAPGIKSDRVTPRFVVRYKPTEQSSVYASFTRGYKAALIDVGGSCQNAPAFQCNQVRPETIDAFEVGAKYGNRRLSAELSAYYYDYKDLQVSSFRGVGQALVTNAARSEIYGVEGSLNYRLSDAFDINAGAAWTHARYKEFTDAPFYFRDPEACGPGTTFCDPPGTNLRNVTMQRTPEFTGNIGARYRTPLAGGEFQLSGNLYYTSKFFFGPSGVQFPQEGYEQLSARAQWTDPSDRFTLALWGDNLTDRRFRTAVLYNSFGLGSTWNPPITYGVEVGARF